jgi:hypothetical protein
MESCETGYRGLAKGSTIPDPACSFFKKIVDVLAGLRFESRLRLDPVCNLNRRSQTHFRIEFEPPTQVSLDQH